VSTAFNRCKITVAETMHLQMRKFRIQSQPTPISTVAENGGIPRVIAPLPEYGMKSENADNPH
jgi:hypothetical protein